MKNTGFPEITDERRIYQGSDPWYMEIALTGRCNFRCHYCNRFHGECDIESLKQYFQTFSSCKHIQITGGEPTLHKDFMAIMDLCVQKASNIGLSTNGTAGLSIYESCGANMFSISLDDYDMDVLKNRGYRKPELVVDTITQLSRLFYVNVGLVIDSRNIDRIEDVIDFILSLGVSDIKLSTSTQDPLIPKFQKQYQDYPILNYRVENFKQGYQMRGWPGKKCYIAVSDVTIVGDSHYPCLVYFREGGGAIGKIYDNVKMQRMEWVQKHTPQKDPICRKYCMDFKCEFNNSQE